MLVKSYKIPAFKRWIIQQLNRLRNSGIKKMSYLKALMEIAAIHHVKISMASTPGGNVCVGMTVKDQKTVALAEDIICGEETDMRAIWAILEKALYWMVEKKEKTIVIDRDLRVHAIKR